MPTIGYTIEEINAKKSKKCFLTALNFEYILDGKRNRKMVKAECECGNTKIIATESMISGRTHSCGCKRILTPDSSFYIKGQRFSKLVVIELAKSNNSAYWLCDCDCGKKTTVKASSLRNGHTKSCGCNIAIAAKTGQSPLTHGGSKTSTYVVWRCMKSRCYNKNTNNYNRYGGKGITVCDRWLHSFENFLADMGERPYRYTLDRVDTNKSYCKENCRWANYQQQANNKNNNRLVEVMGETLTLADAVRKYAVVSYSIVHHRLSVFGWDLKSSLFTPKKINGSTYSKY